MPDLQSIELSESYLNKAFQTLQRIPDYIKMQDYIVAANRSYYAAFYALKAIEILDNYDSKKHSGVISQFRKKYVKTGITTVRYSDIIGKLQDSREIVDYNIVADFSEQDVIDLYQLSLDFVNEMQRIVKQKI